MSFKGKQQAGKLHDDHQSPRTQSPAPFVRITETRMGLPSPGSVGHGAHFFISPVNTNRQWCPFLHISFLFSVTKYFLPFLKYDTFKNFLWAQLFWPNENFRNHVQPVTSETLVASPAINGLEGHQEAIATETNHLLFLFKKKIKCGRGKGPMHHLSSHTQNWSVINP